MGSLFSGYGGLDLAVEQMFDADIRWHSELNPSASKVLEAHWPTVPNLGDITLIDWEQVEPVDILCGGFPCQDISSAGKQAGIVEGNRSGLWFRYADAIRVLRPRLVLVENVSALIGGGGIGVVLGSLAALGFDARWRSVRASDVGCCHRRERVFLVAWAADAALAGLEGRRLLGRSADDNRPAPVASGVGLVGTGRARSGGLGSADRGGSAPDADDRTDDGERSRPQLGFGGQADLALLRTPDAASRRRSGDVKLTGRRPTDPQVSLHDQIAALLPTPVVNDMGDGKSVEWWDEWTEAKKAAHGNGNGHGKSLAIEAARLLPTPTAMDRAGAMTVDERAANDYGPMLRDHLPWGAYGAAIARWEQVHGHPAPEPTGAKGRLSSLFVEWMMGCEPGWVTDIGLPRTAELTMLGNGVVTLQAVAAYSLLLAEISEQVPA